MVLLWLNIISGVVITAIFLLVVIFDRKNTKLDLQNIKLIALAAFLVVISVLLNSIGKLITSTKIFEIKLGNFVLILIGFFCGGVLGILAGIAADFLGLIIYSSGSPILFYTLTSIIWCILPYYLVTFFMSFTTKNWLFYLYLPFTYGFTLLLITGINPIVLKYMYDWEGWWLLYLPRIIKFPLDVIVNSFILIIICRFFINNPQLNPKINQILNNKKHKQKLLNQELINNIGATDD